LTSSPKSRATRSSEQGSNKLGGKAVSRASQSEGQAAQAESRTAQIEQRLHSTFEPVVAAMGLELVQVKLAATGQGGRLQIAIDRMLGQGSVVLGDCARVSRRLSALLDEEDPIAEAYDLEVSSPGINRILRHEADFRRFEGLTAKVTVAMESDGHGAAGKETVKGVIETVADGAVTLRLGKKLTRTIALAEVQKASLDPSLKEWETLGKKLAIENAAYVQAHGAVEEDDADEEDADEEDDALIEDDGDEEDEA
jgi:ribosome maturation factor RimP